VTSNDAPRAGRREWLGLAVLALPTMLLSLDLSVLFLALPHLSADLGASTTEQLWSSDVYGFMTAGFLVSMGTLGDRIGRRKLLLIGATGFVAASVLASFSTSPEMLIMARALMGIAGATLLPSTLGLVRTMFGDPRQLGTAIAVWTTSYMAGVALGPVVGGILLQSFWWGSVFLMAVPVMALLLIAGPLLLPEARDSQAGRLDLVSVVISLVAILPIIYGLKELARHGWEPLPITMIIIGAAFGLLFVIRQRRLADPLLDLSLFRIRSLRAAVLIGLFVALLQAGGTGLVVTLHLQTVEGLSPLSAGLWLVVPALALVVSINLTPALARRFRPAYVIAAGMVITVIGYLVLVSVPSDGGLATLIAGTAIAYFGVGPAAALINQLVLASAPPEKASSAGSLPATSGEFGIALGIATLGSVASAVYRDRLTIPAGVPAEAADTARESIAGGVAAAADLPGALGNALLESARDAFNSGVHVVAIISAVLFAGLALLVLATLRHAQPTGQPQPEPQPDRDAEVEV
jgi:DHA2 family multidrug resistance protein-like MFS transporter